MISKLSKKVFQNSFILFLRMFLVVIIGLISVRFLLENLGILDYGIYNVIFGFFGIVTFYSSSIVDSCQRFFSIEIQNNNFKNLSTYFSYSIILTLILGLVFVVTAATFGVNFVTEKLTIPKDRIDEAIIVFYILVAGFFIQIITLPFNSLILAFEKMRIYAFISIAEVILKLLAVLILFFSPIEKIVLYAIFISLISFFIFLVYLIYCRTVFTNVKLFLFREFSDLKASSTFFGWNMLGSLASVSKNEGTNLILNIFHGPVLNTARGIGFQINGVINTFILNITQAVKLQIYKYYADSKFDELNDLVVKSSKYQFFVVLLLSYPFLFETEFILDFWLKDYPYQAIVFTKLAILLCIVDSLSYSFMAAVIATGKIKFPVIFVSALIILNIPLSYYLLKSDFLPQVIVIVSISISMIAFSLRLYFYAKYYKRSKLTLLKAILVPAILVLLCSLLFPSLVLSNLEPSIYRLIFLLCICIFSVIISAYLFGLDTKEKNVLKGYIKQYKIKTLGNMFINK